MNAGIIIDILELLSILPSSKHLNGWPDDDRLISSIDSNLTIGQIILGGAVSCSV